MGQGSHDDLMGQVPIGSPFPSFPVDVFFQLFSRHVSVETSKNHVIC